MCLNCGNSDCYQGEFCVNMVKPKPYKPCTCGKCPECDGIELERLREENFSLTRRCVRYLEELTKINAPSERYTVVELLDDVQALQEEIVKLKAEVESLQECLDGHK